MPQDTQPPGRFRRILRIVKTTLRIGKWLVVLALIAAVVYVVWTNHRGRGVALEMLKELQARGVAPEPAVEIEEHENAARFYRAAAELLHVPPGIKKSRTPVLGHADWPLPGESFTPQQAEVLNRLIEANELGFAALRQIEPDAATRFDLDPVADLGATMDWLGRSREVGRWYQIDCLAATASDDLDRAVRDCLAAFQLARSMTEDDYLIVMLVRISLAALAQGMTEDLLSRATLDDAQLQALRDAMIRTRESFDLKRAIRHELANVAVGLKDPDLLLIQSMSMQRKMAGIWASMYEAMFKEEIDEETIFELTTWEWVQQASLRTFQAWCPGHFRLEAARDMKPLLGFYDRLTDQTTTPAQLITLGKEETDHKILTGLKTSLRIGMRVSAQLDAAAAAMDVERFRLREGRWPRGLAQVYDEAPIGPYGHALRMTLDGSTCRVYSIGANGIDERGIDRNDEQSTTNEEDDVACKLLTPDRRGRPATTPLDGEPPLSILKSLLQVQQSPDESDQPEQD